MPKQISSRDVLIYLNHLGYNNINAQQLKEFIRDLKKLIKYEEHKKLKTSRTEFNDTTTTDYSPLAKKSKEKNDVTNSSSSSSFEEQGLDVFNALYQQGTCASIAKVVPKKESVISFQIKKSRCLHKCDKQTVSEPVVRKNTEIGREIDVEQQNEDVIVEKDEKKGALPQKSKSFIRPPVRTHTRSDPVALYHRYKAGWERHKIPGENQRTELRWAVREKMLGAQGVRM